jgi:hypothetical protein
MKIQSYPQEDNLTTPNSSASNGVIMNSNSFMTLFQM